MSNGKARKLTISIGAVLSVVVSIFFYIRTDTPTALATFAGLLVVTITLQVETIFRERQDLERETRQQRLVLRVESLPWLADWLDQAAGSMESIENSYGGTMAVNLARAAFRECQAQLADLRRGHYATSDEDESPRSPVRALTENLSKSLLATSVGEDINWWLQESSHRNVYWSLNEQALRRGVTVERIFIYRDWTSEVEKAAKLQHDSGVHVWRVREDHLPQTLRINIMLWDGVCGLEFHSNSAGTAIGQRFTFEREDLELMIDRFNLIKSSARLWDGVTST